MDSRPKMPLQVSSTPTTPHLLSSIIRNGVRESNVMSEGSSGGTNSSRGGAAVGGVPIVGNAVETQNSLGGKNLLGATYSFGSPIESRHAKKFSEHRKAINTADTLSNSNVQQAQYTPQHHHLTANYSPLSPNIEDPHNNTIIQHTLGSADLSLTRGPNSSSNSQNSVQDERNRERPLGFSAIDHSESIPLHNNRRRPFEQNYLQQQQQPKHALTALLPQPRPQKQYTATAAEIALGITPTYNQNVGDGSRINNMISYTDSVSFQGKETDEDASRTSASTDTMSPGRRTPVHDTSIDRIIVGTPSTASTAPSSDDEAMLDYKLDETSTLPKLLHPIHPSLPESAMFSSQSQPSQNPWMQNPVRTNAHGRYPLQQQPSQQQQSHQRVATFRQEGNASHPQHYHPYQQQQQQQRLQPPAGGPRKFPHSYQPAPKVSTPPRVPRNQRLPGTRQITSPSPHQPGSSLQRASSEVLKTLLRKKACLYEPNTSRAVALVTWLVGRLLALEFGFFSRQQLQSGVHACVSNKIEAGTITRTKVNRCMQIILNSCFHYIIPRSDGTEEKGDYFRDSFAESVQDDTLLLQELAEPWNDLVVDREMVIHAILQDVDDRNTNQSSNSNQSPTMSPRHSPKISGMNTEKNPERFFVDGEKEEASKRAVLLCFNENVRSAEDVFRCHNDFIRDTANASHLQLSAQEWSQFFGNDALRDPQFLGTVGVSMPGGVSPGGPQAPPDLLGRMSQDELAKFRTTWCTKRYEHDHDLCGFAHIEINGGWLRRNPMAHVYKNEMCKFVKRETCKIVNQNGEEAVSHFYVNECPKGLACDCAHSIEEIEYHPLNYKMKVCTNPYTRPGGCRLGDVCPHAHPSDGSRPFKKSSPDSRSPDKRGKKNFDQGKSNVKSWATTVPSGSPVVYASPAPISKFEHQLGMPGLQNLFRRQSEVIRAFVRSSGNCQPTYSLFDNEVAISNTPPSTSKK